MLCFSFLGIAQQPGKMTEKFFSDDEIPYIPTPSFHQRGYVNYRDMIKYIEKTISGKDYLKLEYIGETQKNRKIPVVIFKKQENVSAKVMITARIHGDEPGGTESLLYLIERLANDPSLDYFTHDLEIALLPMVNIDGGLRLHRQTANGLDMNRDMSKLETPEALALRKFFHQFSPDVALDLHEYNPFRADYMRFGRFGVTGYADIMFLYCENPNYPKPLKNFVENTYLPSLQQMLDKHSYTYCKYFTSTNQNGEIIVNMGGASPRSTSTAFGLSNTISLLTEIRGANMGKTSFKRRVNIAFQVSLNTLQMAHEKASEIRSVIEQSIGTQSDLIVTQRRTEKVRSIPFIGIHENEIVEVNIPVQDAAQRKKGIVRERPYAYAINRDYCEVIRKLRDFGVSIESLQEDQYIDVEAYLVKDCRESVLKFEGFYEQYVKTEIVPKKIKLEQGTFIIKMSQPYANLIAMLLEPEAENGFVKYNIFSVDEGDELPIYRIVNSF